MGHLSYEDSKAIVLKTILILAVITLIEVFFALLGKGYVISSIHLPTWLVGILMIALSALKAYLIIYEFMHMKYELKALRLTVLLPTILLVWGVIAFLWDGTTWGERRAKDSTQMELTVPVGDKHNSETLELKTDDGHGH
jgi:cytochrome c oxidase subunit IV